MPQYLDPGIANAIVQAFGARSRLGRPTKLAGRWGVYLTNKTNRKLSQSGATISYLLEELRSPDQYPDLSEFLLSNGLPQEETNKLVSELHHRVIGRLKAINIKTPEKLIKDFELGIVVFTIQNEILRGLNNHELYREYLIDRLTPGTKYSLSADPSHGPSTTAIKHEGRETFSRKGHLYPLDPEQRTVYAHLEDPLFNAFIYFVLADPDRITDPEVLNTFLESQLCTRLVPRLSA